MNENIRVMMVDDEDRFRHSTKKVLERRGFEVIAAASGEEALELLHKGPQVVVLDIRMEGMDGLATLKEIKARTPALPVIMLTGHGTGATAEEALACGACDYLSKPCDIDLLAVRIYEALMGQGAAEGEERGVDQVMVPLSEFEVAHPNQSVRYAVGALRGSFSPKTLSGALVESGQRSLLVMEDGKVKGVFSVRGLMESLLPDYVHATLPSTISTIRYSPMFWKGLFATQVKKLMERKVGEVMSNPPVEIGVEANVMEAAYMMVNLSQRRLAVMQEGRCLGLVREEELFFELERLGAQ
ncbi:MAG: response regulator [Desulfobacterales bacterium]|nr:response regulator [Desulfobacterales bacterium]